MNRQIRKQFIAWKNNIRRKPLILTGARQVGKTTSLQRFGHDEYDNVVYLNFEDTPHLKELFELSLEPERIIQALTIDTNQQITPEQTLIIFDEIQECPNALNSLKYFNENANEYHICAAGSLLGVKLTNKKGFPVGKVNFLEMYPLCFLEFLDAVSEAKLKNYLENLSSINPIPGNLHQKLMQYFLLYLYIGGMPEAVAEYVTSKDLSKVRTLHHEILKAYSLDFSKHAPANQIMKINQVWENIPSQLAKENKKFIYSAIRKGARAKEFEIAIQWLKEAGLINKTYNISAPKVPLKGYVNFGIFKLYLVDVGLLAAMSEIPPNIILQGDKFFQEFRGSFVENFAAQELAHNHTELYYWTSEGKAELDFLFQHQDIIYPLEIKSGATTKKKSLLVYGEKYQPDLLIRASAMNLKKDGKILNCPLYLLGELPRLLQLLH